MTSGGLRNPKGTPSECSLFIDNIGLQYTFAVCVRRILEKQPIFGSGSGLPNFSRQQSLLPTHFEYATETVEIRCILRCILQFFCV